MAQSLPQIQRESAIPPHARNQNATAKQFDKRRWHKKTANVVDIECTTSLRRSSWHRSESPPVLAVNALTSASTQLDTRAVCYDPAHSTLGCMLLPWDAPPNIVAIHEGYLRGKNTSSWPQRPPNPNCHLNNQKRFHHNRHLFFSSRRSRKVSQYADSAPPPAKNKELRYHGQ